MSERSQQIALYIIHLKSNAKPSAPPIKIIKGGLTGAYNTFKFINFRLREFPVAVQNKFNCLTESQTESALTG